MFISKKYYSFVFVIFMALTISSAMSFIAIFSMFNFSLDFLYMWGSLIIKTYSKTLPIALCGAPLVKKFVDYITY